MSKKGESTEKKRKGNGTEKREKRKEGRREGKKERFLSFKMKELIPLGLTCSVYFKCIFLLLFI